MRKLITGLSALGLSLLISSPAFAYEVERGDTMSEIAERNNLTLQELSKANPQIKDVNLIYVGQEINTPGETVVKEQPSQQPQTSEKAETLTVKATAYTPFCYGCSGITRTGIDLRANPNQKVIAVDPKVIPLGSKVYVEGYGMAIAGDTGGAIKGNRIDILMPTRSAALDFGRQTVQVTVYK